MTAQSGDSLEKIAQRENVFALLRLSGLALLAAGFALDAQLSRLPLLLVLEVATGALVLSAAAWWLLRVRSLIRLIALLGAIGDAGILVFFISISGGFASPLWPFALALSAAATLRYGSRGGFFAALAFAALEIVFGAVSPLGLGVWLEAAVHGSVLVAVMLAFGWIIQLERRQMLLESDQAKLALQHSQSDVKSFAALTDGMAGNTDYRATLRQMLELSLRSLRARGQADDSLAGMILLYSSKAADELKLAAQVQLEDPDQARSLSPLSGAIQTVLSSVDPVMLRDARRDPLLSQFETIRKYPAAIVLPLRSGLVMFGVAVFLGHDKLLDLYSQRQELMQAYAVQAAIAIQNTQLFAQLEAERNHIVDNEERVRHELARDLHDGPVNQVASLAMGIDFARVLLDKEPQTARAELINLQRLAAKTARDMRTTMYRLRPLALESAGLSVAMDQYIARLRSEHTKPVLHFAAPDAASYERRLSSNSATMVFDIMNEAISNALKHAQAENIWVELHASGNMLVASARDDGRGFDVAGVQAGYASRGSLGMLNIQERAELAQGDSSIVSVSGRGTTVSVRVPLGA